jgi:hypothetical protein
LLALWFDEDVLNYSGRKKRTDEQILSLEVARLDRFADGSFVAVDLSGINVTAK